MDYLWPEQVERREANTYDTAYAECAPLPNVPDLLETGNPFEVARRSAAPR